MFKSQKKFQQVRVESRLGVGTRETRETRETRRQIATILFPCPMPNAPCPMPNPH
ncbi:hypothetical protein [Nostoc linckia]|uniref:hypothetical protein n=1 Tax=Nostoc linckia TaxID=92942 RepID=UPI001C558E3A|nr:hypothetical protein [Nostoc linckia]